MEHDPFAEGRLRRAGQNDWALIETEFGDAALKNRAAQSGDTGYLEGTGWPAVALAEVKILKLIGSHPARTPEERCMTRA